MVTQTETKQTNKKEIDWEKTEKYVRQIIFDLAKDLSQKLLFLEKVEPFIELDTHPPRISVYFCPKGKPEAPAGVLFRAFPLYEKELNKNLEKITLIITEIAKKYNLEAKAGTFFTHCETILVGGKKRNYHKRCYSNEVGKYTLQPFYKQFIKLR